MKETYKNQIRFQLSLTLNHFTFLKYANDLKSLYKLFFSLFKVVCLNTQKNYISYN